MVLSAAPEPRMVVVAEHNELRRIGAWRLAAGHNLSDALRAFGKPSRLTSLYAGNGCRVRWSSKRVIADFDDYGGRPRGESVCSSRHGYLTSARLGRGWRTSRGVRVGASSHVIRRRYPAATYVNGRWWLVTKRQVVGTDDPNAHEPVLAASVRKGRVSSLLASRGTID